MWINQSAKGQEKVRANHVTFARILVICCLVLRDGLIYIILEIHKKKMLFVSINCSFDSPENRRMSKKILSEVQSVYGKKKWEKSVIKGKFPELFICIYLFTLEAPELRSVYMALV